MDDNSAKRAEELVRAHLGEILADADGVNIEAIQLAEIGWLFTYQTRVFLETGDFREALLGNSPIIVDFNGRIHEPRSGDALEQFIARLRQSLNPHLQRGQ